MASVSIYLIFRGNAEEAFNHYRKVFGTEFSTPLMWMKDAPLRVCNLQSEYKNKKASNLST
jgi:PhnB protein